MEHTSFTPLLSICMPFYNASRYLKESIQSVLDQTFDSFELLLINDGSTDDSLQVVGTFADPRIRVVTCPHDFIQSLNTGLEVARGKYIARMDADDIMLPQRLQIQYDFMESHPDIAVCGTGMEYFGREKGEYIPQWLTPEEIPSSLVLSCPLAHPTMMIRRSVLTLHNIRYNPDYIYVEDFKLCADIVKHGKLANIPRVLLRYRVSDSQICNRYAVQQAGLSRIIRKEMVDYYFSLLSVDTALGNAVRTHFLPIVEQFNEQAYLSCEEYFHFMYTLIRSFMARNLIKLTYDKS